MTRSAILEPFSGIAGDMTLGALVAVGLEPRWLEELPGRLGLDGVGVDVRQVMRGEIRCWKVDFDIPPQPHGRHLKQIRELVERSEAPAAVRESAGDIFESIATAEAEIHGTTVEKVHLHEVGAVDAILDVVGAVWGLSHLGIDTVYCGAISLGDGFVRSAHGVLPVPAPATLKLLEGHPVRPGPPGSGELVTPTGAALVRRLSAGPPPIEYVPLATGYGAGTKELPDRANALRMIVAEVSDVTEGVSQLVEVVTEIDDMTPEYVAAAADSLRAGGALDVCVSPTIMKHGRPGIRLEVLSTVELVEKLENLIFSETSSIGLRRRRVERRALPRRLGQVTIGEHSVGVKTVTLPDGTSRTKPDFRDVQKVALATGRSVQDIYRSVLASQER